MSYQSVLRTRYHHALPLVTFDQEMSQSTTWDVQNRLRSLVVSLNLSLSEVMSLVTTFKTALAATASKVETYHHLLQLSNAGSCLCVSCSPVDASYSFASKILRMKILQRIS